MYGKIEKKEKEFIILSKYYIYRLIYWLSLIYNIINN